MLNQSTKCHYTYAVQNWRTNYIVLNKFCHLRHQETNPNTYNTLLPSAKYRITNLASKCRCSSMLGTLQRRTHQGTCVQAYNRTLCVRLNVSSLFQPTCSTRILAGYRVCHVTYQLKISSMNLMLVDKSHKLNESESGSLICRPSSNLWRKY